MSSTTDRYRRHHGDTAYARLAARAAFAGLESLAADLVVVSVSGPGTPSPSPASPASPASTPRPAASGSQVTCTGGTTPGSIAGRNTAGRALPLRGASHLTAAPTTS